MKKAFVVIAVSAGLLAASATEDFAFVYRGRITAQSGSIPSELRVKYALYKTENGAAPVWTQEKTERPSADGAFQSILSGGGLQAAFIDEKARFLGVTLGEGGREQYPRQEVLASPLAFFAERVAEAPAGATFKDARVESANVETFSVGTLDVTNRLDLGGTGSISLSRAVARNGATLKIRKPQMGHVILFGATSEYPRGTVFPKTPHGFYTYVSRTPVVKDHSTNTVPFVVTFPHHNSVLSLPSGIGASFDGGDVFGTLYSGN